MNQAIMGVALLLLPICTLLLYKPEAGAHSPDSVLEILARLESGYTHVNDYIALFHKQERVKGRLLPEKTIFLKFKKPLKVYMKWTEGSCRETQALYVQGENNDKVVVRQSGMIGLGTISLDPRGQLAMHDNRHPITEAGFGFLIDTVRRNIRAALNNGDLEIVKSGDEIFQGRPTTVLEVKANPHAAQKYYAYRMICHIDKELSLPVAMALFDESEQLFEKYSYTDIKLNVGLTEMDFSKGNDEYGF